MGTMAYYYPDYNFWGPSANQDTYPHAWPIICPGQGTYVNSLNPSVCFQSKESVREPGALSHIMLWHSYVEPIIE